MERPIEVYWGYRLGDLKERLEENNFEAFIANDAAEAGRIVKEEIIPGISPGSVSWGGSMTFTESGLYDALKGESGFEVIDAFDKNASTEEKWELRRRGLLVDLFITGTNAVTETGELVNLDMTGNRVAALTFGPKYVVVLVGRNKVVPDLESGILRIKDYAAPANAMRLDKKTPCVKTSYCEDCSSPDRICNTWVITEKSYPKGRVKVVLINAELGL